MNENVGLGIGLVLMVLVVGGIASLSHQPTHRSLPDGVGIVSLSFNHGADRRAACRPATPEELAKLPPNMRRTEVCPRARPPIRVAFAIDGETVFDREIAPSGIAKDGPSRVHHQFTLPVGDHELHVQLADRPGGDFEWDATQQIELKSGDHRVIDFRADAGGFRFH